MDKFNRAVRRHHNVRLRKVRSKYYGGLKQLKGQGRLVESRINRALGLRVNTATLCSCTICGNPRRYFKELTLQELRFNSEEDNV